MDIFLGADLLSSFDKSTLVLSKVVGILKEVAIEVNITEI